MATKILTIDKFQGINRTETKNKNNAHELKNFDLRTNLGELTTRGKYKQILTAPAYNNILAGSYVSLGADSFIVDMGGVKKEVTIAIGKGKVTKSNSGATLNNLDTLIISMSPHYNGSAWVNAWGWINETVIDRVTSYGSDNKVGFSDGARRCTPLTTVYNHTKGNYSSILIPESGWFGGVVSGTNTTHFGINDEVIVYKNFHQDYIKMAALATAIQPSDVYVYKVINDIRMAFGGYENRLPISIGSRKKEFRISNYGAVGSFNQRRKVLNDFNQICLDAYNISEDDAVIGTELKTGEVVHRRLTDYEHFNSNVFVTITAILDDVSEFIIYRDNVALSYNVASTTNTLEDIKKTTPVFDNVGVITANNIINCFDTVFTHCELLDSVTRK
jgi:hypothetical protein